MAADESRASPRRRGPILPSAPPVAPFNAQQNPFGESCHLFQGSQRRIRMQTATAQRTSEWAALERDYRDAWQALTQQVGVWSSLTEHPTDDRSETEERCRQLKLLEDRYREARDRLADYMLASLQDAKTRAQQPRLVQAHSLSPLPKAVARKSVLSLSLGCC